MRALAILLVLTAACGSSSPKPPSTGGTGGSGGIATGGSGGGASCHDNDGDGYEDAACGGPDCDDSDPGVYPGAKEICKDGKDQNCDGMIDEGCACSAGEMRACFTGAAASRNVGACRDGYQRCSLDGVWGPCAGEVDPTAEPATCDGIDQDCDGSDVTACSGCLDHDICGNGLDDDCNGTIDDPAVCATSCAPAESPLPDYLDCCTDRSPYSYFCTESPGLPACESADRACLDLDGDPTTHCAKHCAGDGTCVCGRSGTSQPAQVPDCGFETSCAHMDCGGRTGQNCYTGPPASLGVGLCHAGLASCTDLAWGSCVGQVVPALESCGNGTDDDCDGLIDEDDGTGHPCPRTDCAAAAEEACDNGFDDDCDGFVDEGCPVPAGEDTQDCYSGPLVTLGRGPCKGGSQARQQDGFWGPCQGEVVPAVERCGDGLDTDCNLRGGPGEPEDPGCCKPSGDETCNGMDDDCDGLVDEGLLNACGGCNTSCGGTIALSDMSTCTGPGRTCTKLVSASGGGLTLDNSVPLIQGTDTGIYFGTVLGLRRFDTKRGVTDWDYPFSISATTFYAASADGSVWIDDATVQKLIHLAPDGSEKCTFVHPTGLTGRSVAVDEEGSAWVLFVGTPDSYLYKFTASNVAGMPAACVPEALGADTDGLLIDVSNPGFVESGPPPALWVTGDPVGLRLDRSTLEAVKVQMPSGSYLGHPDVSEAGDLWLTLTNGGLARIPAADDGTHATIYPAVNLYEVNVLPDGTVWGCLATEQLAFLDPATGMTTTVAPPDGTANERDAVVDYKGRLWMTGIDAQSVRSVQGYDPVAQKWSIFTGHDPETIYVDEFCDRSSATQQHFSVYTGSFSQDVDGGAGGVTWTSAAWTADVPMDASLEVRIKVSDRLDNLDAQKGCGPFTTSPADLSTCSGGARKGRYLRMVAAMRGGKAVPVLKGVQLDYQLP